MFKYMVSYQLRNGQCGNQCGSLAEVNAFAERNKAEWKSHSFLRYAENHSGIYDAVLCDADGNPKVTPPIVKSAT